GRGGGEVHRHGRAGKVARPRRHQENDCLGNLGRVRGSAQRVAEPSCSNLSPSVPTALSVRVGPGATVLKRIPLAPKAAAQDRVKDSSAASAAATGPSATSTDAPIVEMLTMAPDPRAIIFGSSAAVR